MPPIDQVSRRRMLQSITLSIPLFSLAGALPNTAHAAEAPLLSPEAAEAKAVKYVEDATQAKGALPGSTCASCALYQGKSGSTIGPCQIFSGKQVKAAGWCSSWAPQM